MRQPWWEEVPVVSPRVAYIPATMATLYLGPLSKLGGGDGEETGTQRREAFTWHTNTLLAGTRASPEFKEAASARKALCPPLLGRQPLLGRPGSGSQGGLPWESTFPGGFCSTVSAISLALSSGCSVVFFPGNICLKTSFS